MNRTLTAIIATALLTLAGPTLDAQTCVPRAGGAQAFVTGTTVTLSWGLCPVGGTFLEVWSRAGVRLFAGSVGPVQSVTGTLPPGEYYFLVSTPEGSRFGGAEFTVPGGAPGGPAGPPTALTFTRVGLLVTLSWSAPVSGGPVSEYLVEAGSAPGAIDLAIVRTLTATLSATAPPGTYYVRVRARTTAGLGPASPEIVIVIPGSAPPPGTFWRPCSDVVRSLTSVTIVPIEFVNTSSQPRRLYWIDFAGTRQNYGVLSPGQSGFINTWVTHSWVIADLADNCLETFVVSGAERRVEIR